MRYCFFGKSVLFIQERKRNRFGLFVCLNILSIMGLRRWVDPRNSRITAGVREKSSAGDTLFLCPRAPRPPSAAERIGLPSRLVWAVGCVGASRWRLGHSPCPVTHTHTHTLHFRYTTPSSAALFAHPLTHLMLHTSLLTKCASVPS